MGYDSYFILDFLDTLLQLFNALILLLYLSEGVIWHGFHLHKAVFIHHSIVLGQVQFGPLGVTGNRLSLSDIVQVIVLSEKMSGTHPTHRGNRCDRHNYLQFSIHTPSFCVKIITLARKNKPALQEEAMAKILKELQFKTTNDVGMLSQITQALKENHVNLLHAWACGEGQIGYFGLVTNNNGRAKKALRRMGIQALERDVLSLNLTQRTGELAKAAKKLTGARINIVASRLSAHSNNL